MPPERSTYKRALSRYGRRTIAISAIPIALLTAVYIFARLLSMDLSAIGGPLCLAATVWLFAKYFEDRYFRRKFPLRPERYSRNILVQIPFIVVAIAVQNDLFIKLSLTVLACLAMGICLISAFRGRPIRGYMSKMAPKNNVTRVRLFFSYFVCVFAVEASLNTLVALQFSTDVWVFWRVAFVPLFIFVVSLPPALWFAEFDGGPHDNQTATN